MTDELITAKQTEMELPAVQPKAENDDINVFRPNDIPDNKRDLIQRHKKWLNNLRKEFPKVSTPYRIGVYIRYYNQTKHEDYLSYHKKEYESTIALCPQWTLVDFYVDNGPFAPNMESAPEWCRLLNDCFEGKVNLIITQKISNVSRKAWDLTLIIRLLAAQNIGIYFISEDIFTTASYYQRDMLDLDFCKPELRLLPEDNNDENTALPPGGQDVE